MQDSIFLICFNILLEQTEMLLPKIHNSQIKLKCILIITLAFQRLMLRLCFPCSMYFKGDQAVTIQGKYCSEMD